MVQTVEIFYSFACPYSYLATDELGDIKKQFDVEILWQPLLPSKPTTVKINGDEAKTSFIIEDATRIAKERKVPIRFIDNWPSSEFHAESSVYGAIVAMDLDILNEYNIKVFDRWWGQAEDPTAQNFTIMLCDELDIDPNDYVGRLNSTDVKKRARGIQNRAHKIGVFDTPTLVVDGERFVGIRSIADCKKKLKELGLEKPQWSKK